jgi:hypothetical protein
MKRDPLLAPEPHSLTDIAEMSRGGALPPDWLDSYGDHLRRSHAKAAAEINALYTKVAKDPAALARLKDARF